MTDQGHMGPGDQESKGFRPKWAKTLFSWTPWGVRQAIDDVVARLDAIDRRLDSIEQSSSHRDGRLDAVEEGIRSIQNDIQSVSDQRLPRLEVRVDEAERTIGAVEFEAERLRDDVVPAVVDRGNVLIDRLAEELDEVASLVERMLLAEPLPTLPGTDVEQISDAIAAVQPQLLEAFRGPEEEIRHRLEHHLGALRDSAPILDLGCGRGELLLLLREAGLEARGVDSDVALVQGARRRGLDVIDGDVFEALRAQEEDAFGAVTAIHLLEHLRPDGVLELLRQAHRVLRSGGIFLAECPNPHSLRVGAALYWRDPTHRRPLLPETLDVFFKASGFEVRGIEFLHPFPDDQRLAPMAGETPADVPQEVAAMYERLTGMERRLDDLLNGSRDFAIVAVKP